MSTNTTTDGDVAPTDQLLGWASRLTVDDLTAAAISRLKDDIVDGLGAGLFGSTLPATRALREVLSAQSDHSDGPCALWGTTARTSALSAVVVNGAGLNGFELDSGSHLTRNVHGAMAVYPVILAVSELTGRVTGADMLAAAAAGWETGVRVSKALGPSVMDRGWYGTPIYATLGAAVAAGRALHLDVAQMQAAFELALLHASGLTVSSEEGMGKPLSSGEAVRSGLLCALLAQRGCRGPRHSWDHEKGFATAFSLEDERNDDHLVVKPEDPLACEHISFKVYASCGAGHPVADILDDMLAGNTNMTASTVDRVDIRLGVTSAHHIGGPYVPSDVTNAQFNLAYCVAAQLLEGDNSIRQFRPELLADPRILDLTRKVHVTGDETVGSRSTALRRESYVTVHLSDGTSLHGHAENKRDPNRDAIRRKFYGLASHVIADDAARELVAHVQGLEDAEDTSVVAALLQPF